MTDWQPNQNSTSERFLHLVKGQQVKVPDCSEHVWASFRTEVTWFDHKACGVWNQEDDLLVDLVAMYNTPYGRTQQPRTTVFILLGSKREQGENFYRLVGLGPDDSLETKNLEQAVNRLDMRFERFGVEHIQFEGRQFGLLWALIDRGVGPLILRSDRKVWYRVGSGKKVADEAKVNEIREYFFKSITADAAVLERDLFWSELTPNRLQSWVWVLVIPPLKGSLARDTETLGRLARGVARLPFVLCIDFDTTAQFYNLARPMLKQLWRRLELSEKNEPIMSFDADEPRWIHLPAESSSSVDRENTLFDLVGCLRRGGEKYVFFSPFAMPADSDAMRASDEASAICDVHLAFLSGIHALFTSHYLLVVADDEPLSSDYTLLKKRRNTFLHFQYSAWRIGTMLTTSTLNGFRDIGRPGQLSSLEAFPGDVATRLTRYCEVVQPLPRRTLSAQDTEVARSFFRAEIPIPWFLCSTPVCVERDVFPHLLADVEQRLKDKNYTTVLIHHEPGAGGSTVGRQLIYRLALQGHLCVRARPDAEDLSAFHKVLEIAAKHAGHLICLIDDEMQRHLGQYWAVPGVLFINVVQFPAHNAKMHSQVLERLSRSERDKLYTAFDVAINVGHGDFVNSKLAELEALDQEQYSIFYLMLCALEHDFKGLSSYVTSYTKDLDPLQVRALTVLAIIRNFSSRPLPYSALKHAFPSDKVVLTATFGTAAHLVSLRKVARSRTGVYIWNRLVAETIAHSRKTDLLQACLDLVDILATAGRRYDDARTPEAYKAQQQLITEQILGDVFLNIPISTFSTAASGHLLQTMENDDVKKVVDKLQQARSHSSRVHLAAAKIHQYRLQDLETALRLCDYAQAEVADGDYGHFAQVIITRGHLNYNAAHNILETTSPTLASLPDGVRFAREAIRWYEEYRLYQVTHGLSQAEQADGFLADVSVRFSVFKAYASVFKVLVKDVRSHAQKEAAQGNDSEWLQFVIESPMQMWTVLAGLPSFESYLVDDAIEKIGRVEGANKTRNLLDRVAKSQQKDVRKRKLMITLARYYVERNHKLENGLLNEVFEMLVEEIDQSMRVSQLREWHIRALLSLGCLMRTSTKATVDYAEDVINNTVVRSAFKSFAKRGLVLTRFLLGKSTCSVGDMNFITTELNCPNTQLVRDFDLHWLFCPSATQVHTTTPHLHHIRLVSSSLKDNELPRQLEFDAFVHYVDEKLIDIDLYGKARSNRARLRLPYRDARYDAGSLIRQDVKVTLRFSWYGVTLTSLRLLD